MTKETIIKAIQRLAAASGGVPPGRLKLESETGIAESAWRGVYWAKWNDAVREAGFEPNKMTSAYSTEQLLGVLAQLTREFGHIPTYAELRLATRKKPNMPSDTTISRLGTKAEMVYVPAGVEVRYRVWRADPEAKPAPQG